MECSIADIPNSPVFPTMTTRASSPIEIALNQPTPFDGNRKRTNIFIQECSAYLQINDAIYNADDTKIAFILSYMTGKAQPWKRLFFEDHINKTTGKFDFPTYSVFIGKLKEDFKTENRGGEALTKLYRLKQGNRTAEELVARFKFLAMEAGLGFETHSDHIHMIRLFQFALKPQLTRQILLGNEVPKKIEGWFERAIHIEMVLAFTAGKSPRKQETKTGNRSWNFSKPTAKSPSTTDIIINAMSQQERTDLMKKGACFRCKKRGHRARDCPPEENTPEKKRTAKDIYALLQSMIEEK